MQVSFCLYQQFGCYMLMELPSCLEGVACLHNAALNHSLKLDVNLASKTSGCWISGPSSWSKCLAFIFEMGWNPDPSHEPLLGYSVSPELNPDVASWAHLWVWMPLFACCEFSLATDFVLGSVLTSLPASKMVGQARWPGFSTKSKVLDSFVCWRER